jgi:hypothetical protein
MKNEEEIQRTTVQYMLRRSLRDCHGN